MTALWRAFESSDSALANGLFFPRSAYLRMKRGLLASPASDYTDRLMAFYRLDLAVYHQQVSSLPGRLVRIEVDRAASVWIAPGTCENLIGYWHLPGVRFVYARSGRLWSFGVASLISWRGVWYVVHLGPNPRARNVGALDAPASGPGAPGPLGGC